MMLPKNVFKFCLLCYGSTMFGVAFWNDLPGIQKMSQSNQEFVVSDNADCFNISFDNYYKKLSNMNWYDWIMRIFERLIGKEEQSIEWPAAEFAQLLEQAVIAQKKQKDTIIELTPKPATNFIVIGPLYGAFQALARIFSQLDSMGFLYKDVSLKQQCYLVFLGDCINKSPYSLETLAVIAKLIIQNAGKVIVLKGPQETDMYWKQGSLGKELDIKIPSKMRPTIEKLLTTFFDTLNNTLTLHYLNRHSEQSSVLLSCKGYDALKIPITSAITTQMKGDIFDVIYHASSGLRYAEAERGVTTWALLSSPIDIYQACYHYSNDSFVVLETTKPYNDWLLTHYMRNIKTGTQFEKFWYNAMTGQQYIESQAHNFVDIDPKPMSPLDTALIDHGNEIVIGAALTLSRNIRDLGFLSRKGLTLCFNRENREHGGINNKFIRLVALDNEYSDAPTRALANVLLNTFKTPLCVSSLGTGATLTLATFAAEHNMLLLFPYTGSDAIRTEKMPCVINLRASYQSEATALVDYALQTLKKKKIAILYQEDGYGRVGRDAALARLKEHYNIENIVSAGYQANTVNVQQAVEKIKNSLPEVIFFFSVQTTSEEFVRIYGLYELANVSLLGISPLTDAFKDHLRDMGLTVFLSRVVPDPVTSDLAIAKEFREALAKYMPDEPVTDTVFEAYINAQFLVDTLKNMSEPFTIEKLATYFTGIKNVNYKGLQLNFDPQTRTLMHDVWIDDGRVWSKVSVA